MSDGPFKNLKLHRRWKRFAEAVQNDAVGGAETRAMASHAVLTEILTDSVRALFADLQGYARQEQFSLDAVSSVEEIFSRHSKTAFTDTFQKEVEFRLNDKVPFADAMKPALLAALGEHLHEVKNRIIEECIVARDFGGMWSDQFNRTVSEATAVLGSLEIGTICDAVLAGDRRAFMQAVSKKRGLDEGPSFEITR